MPESQWVAKCGTNSDLVMIGVDTCGASGTVALARVRAEKLAILEQRELAGRTYSATLVATIADILKQSGLKLRELSAIVVVNGPGSFTGVRVGLSAVKGLAEPGQIPVVPVSRLDVLAAKAGLRVAALDAHRHEIFLRVSELDGTARELLAGAEDLAAIPVPVSPIAVCEEAAGLVLRQAWPEANLVRTLAPTAFDAMERCLPRILASDFTDLALLDGHYLRRSDAEIFADRPSKTSASYKSIRVRRMRQKDVDLVTELAKLTEHVPAWPRKAYEIALDSSTPPRRVALVAEDTQSGRIVGFAVANLIAARAELEAIATALAHRRQGVARELFSALKNELRHAGTKEVILEVRAGNNRAQAFYRFLGFAEEGRRPRYYADPIEDAVLMRLPIS